MWIIKFIPSKILSLQARKPSSFLGRYVMSKLFTRGNADLNHFVKACLQLQVNDQVLEIGYGPGMLVNEMAKTTQQGLVQGIDFSSTMFAEATALNQAHITAGRVILHQGECRSLPFADDNFTKLCSVNTIYFFDKPETYLQEMHRVLKAKGQLVIGFRDKEQMQGLNLSEEVFTLYSRDEVKNLLLNAGFDKVVIEEKEGVPFKSYCALAYKSA